MIVFVGICIFYIFCSVINNIRLKVHVKLIKFCYFLDTFTVDQAVNATGFGKFQVKLSLVMHFIFFQMNLFISIIGLKFLKKLLLQFHDKTMNY